MLYKTILMICLLFLIGCKKEIKYEVPADQSSSGDGGEPTSIEGSWTVGEMVGKSIGSMTIDSKHDFTLYLEQRQIRGSIERTFYKEDYLIDSIGNKGGYITFVTSKGNAEGIWYDSGEILIIELIEPYQHFAGDRTVFKLSNCSKRE